MKFSDYVCLCVLCVYYVFMCVVMCIMCVLCVYVFCSIPHGPPGTRRRGASRCQWLGRRRPPEPRSTDAPHRGPDLNALSGKSMISEIQWLKILWGCDDTWFSPQVGEKGFIILFDVLFPSKSKITTLCKPAGLRIFGNYKKTSWKQLNANILSGKIAVFPNPSCKRATKSRAGDNRSIRRLRSGMPVDCRHVHGACPLADGVSCRAHTGDTFNFFVRLQQKASSVLLPSKR